MDETPDTTPLSGPRVEGGAPRRPASLAAAPRSPFLDKYGLRAVIFDMDGVLLETMSTHYEAYCRVLEPEGLGVEAIEISSREGLGTPAVLQSLSEARGWNLPPEKIRQLADKRREIFYQIYQHRVFPEVPETLNFLRDAGYALGVVSGATQQSLDVCLNQHECQNGKGLAQWFSVIISGTTVTQGKPHPEPYLKALEQLKIEGRQALVVENATAGIQAAKAAGCYCAAIETTLDFSYLRNADWVVPNHAALLRLLKE